jgi:branched-chain amino acid aminotransferase
MLTISWNDKNGWGKPEIKPFAPFQIHPFNSSLHYAVEVF